MIPIFIPPLVALLANLEKQKGAPLTEEEVVAARDKGVCMAMRVSEAQKLAQSRGYDDLDPEHVWEEWQVARKQLMEGGC